MLFLRLRSISPAEDYSVTGDFLAKSRVFASLINIQKKAYTEAFFVLSDYLPSIIVPKEEIHCEPPIPNSLAPIGGASINSLFLNPSKA